MTAPDRRLPANAKCVFKGIIFDVWQWQQTMYDGSTQTFEMLKRPDTAVIIPVVEDKLLLTVQEQPDKAAPFRSFPGGRCDNSDKPLEEAKRELLEETGYASSDWTHWMSYEPTGKLIWTVHVFIARHCTSQQPPRPDAGEKISTMLITFDELLMLSEDPMYRGGDFVETLLRARLNPAKREQLRRDLFG